MRRYQIYFAQMISIAAVALLAIFLNRWSDFQARCFRSQVFDRLIEFSTLKEAPHCSQVWHVLDFSGQGQLELRRPWGHWLAQLDQLVPQLAAPQRQLKMVLINEMAFQAQIEDSFVLLSEDQALARRQFQRVALTGWISKVAKGITQIEAQVLTEFYLALVHGTFTVAGFDLKEIENVQAQNTLIKSSEYCLSQLRTPFESAECTTEQGESYRPILAAALWHIYQNQSFKGREQLLEWLKEQVLGGHISLLSSRPGDGSLGSGLEWIQSELERWSELHSRTEFIRWQIEEIESAIGLEDFLRPQLAIYGITPEDLQPYLGENTVLVGQGTNWWQVNADSILPIDVDAILPQHLVLLDCQKHRLGSMAQLAAKSVLWMRACGSDQIDGLKGWRWLASNYDIRAFIAENETVNMIWLNVRGMKGIVSQFPEIAQRTFSLKKLRRISHWKEDHWSGGLKAFVPRAAIDVVISHRAAFEML